MQAYYVHFGTYGFSLQNDPLAGIQDLFYDEGFR